MCIRDRLCATVAAGVYADRWVALAEASRLTKMRAAAVVFATGVIETPAVFRGNDLPGVMPVSYTHLDVYKRQIEERRGAVLAPRRAARRGGFRFGFHVRIRHCIIRN